MNTTETPSLPLTGGDTKPASPGTPETPVNPTTQNGENPHQIGDAIASPPQPKKKRNRTRFYRPQEERLQSLVETLKAPEHQNDPEKVELLRILTHELDTPADKKRLKLIYRAEEKLQAWGICPKEEKLLEPTPENTPKEKQPLDAKSQLIATAKNIEAKLEFCKSQGLELKSAKRYQRLQENALKATKLPEGKKEKAFQKLLKEAQETEQAILDEHDEQVLQEKNLEKRTFGERWFLFKLKLLIFLLFPNDQWEEAAQILNQAAQSCKCKEKTKKSLSLCAQEILPKEKPKSS